MSRPDKSLRQLTSYRLRRASIFVESEFACVFSEFDLRRTTFSVLSLIADRPGLRQSDLAAALSIERTNLVLLVDELEARGLAKRHVAPNDRRAYNIQPTAAGRHLYEKAMSAALARDKELTSNLTSDQVATLHLALKSIEANAHQMETLDELEISRP